MEDFLMVLLEGFSNAYILFCAFLGIYAVVLAGQNSPLSGNFWGAMWMNTALAALVLLVALLLVILGENAARSVYYLYQLYFVISLPGIYAIMQGNDNQRAALAFGIVAFFNSAAAYRASSLLF